MAKISAFVGHSFQPQDEVVVRKFTDFFNLIAKRGEFEWDHAAEPRTEELDAKVLEIFEDRNLFIGICTPNECVAKQSQFISVRFGNYFKIKSENLQSKTSDWIIQEIGLAIGRGMNIIILLQQGVRKPGSLQGDIEYISFDCKAVEESFSKILAMITNLQSTATVSARTTSSPTKSASSDEDFQENAIDKNSEEPNDTWDEQKFEIEFFVAVILKEAERADNISNAWIERHVTDPEAVAVWEAYCLLQKTRNSDTSCISELTSIAKRYPKIARIQRYLAQAYLYFDDQERARDTFQASLDKCEDIAEKRRIMGDLANVYQSLGDSGRLAFTISEMRGLVESSDDEKDLLSKLENFSVWHSDNNNLKLAIMEREVKIDPADTQKRFQLAYAHSKYNNAPLSLYHYEKIPSAQRDAITWNNLGVAYQNFSLSGLAVSAYQSAANERETLAMSNLAEKLMSAGFLKEAQSELDRAKEIGDVHKGEVHNNVAKSQVRLDAIPLEEQESRTTKLKEAPTLANFLAEVGHQVWQSGPTEMGGIWASEEVSLNVHREEDTITAEGSFQRSQTERGGLLAAQKEKDEKSVETFDVKISGRLLGSVLVGEYITKRRRSPLESVGLLDLYPRKQEFIAIIDAKRRVLRCLFDKEIREFAVRD